MQCAIRCIMQDGFKFGRPSVIQSGYMLNAVIETTLNVHRFFILKETWNNASFAIHKVINFHN
jgi:hypothetical protein